MPPIFTAHLMIRHRHITHRHFNARKTDVFVAFLDCSKAFDKISHHGLFLKLIERGVPLCLLLLIVFWHLNLSARVKWGDGMSDSFQVPLGIKQGGITSPKFFAIYVDDLISLLRRSGYGCYIIRMFVGCILFADDMALIAPSRSALQKMIDICCAFCSSYCLRFNSKKSKVMTFGRSYNEESIPLVIDGEALQYVSE